jgi:hypothetical protein
MSAFRLAAFVVMTMSLHGCSKADSRSTGAATTQVVDNDKVHSRQVRFAMDGPASVVSQPNVATITFSEGKLNIERGRALLNDKEVAKVPDEAKVVDIDYTRGRLTVTADDKKVYESKLR